MHIKNSLLERYILYIHLRLLFTNQLHTFSIQNQKMQDHYVGLNIFKVVYRLNASLFQVKPSSFKLRSALIILSIVVFLFP